MGGRTDVRQRAETPPDWTMISVSVPRQGGRLPGITMAGFSQYGPVPFVDMAMVAHPAVTVVVDLSESGAVVYDTDGRHRQHGSAVVGLLPGDLRVTGRGTLDCLQIRLEPVVAATVLGGSGQLTGAVVTLADLWGRDAARFEGRLRAAPTWDERFAIAAGAFRRKIDRWGVDPEVDYTWRKTRAGRGRVRIDGLAADVGWSRKLLWSRFRSQLGITPKLAARLVRFDHAAHLLAAGRAPADVATASGFVDQSHLHREVRAFAGRTPTAVAAAPWLSIDDRAWPDQAAKKPLWG